MANLKIIKTKNTSIASLKKLTKLSSNSILSLADFKGEGYVVITDYGKTNILVINTTIIKKKSEQTRLIARIKRKLF